MMIAPSPVQGMQIVDPGIDVEARTVEIDELLIWDIEDLLMEERQDGKTPRQGAWREFVATAARQWLMCRKASKP